MKKPSNMVSLDVGCGFISRFHTRRGDVGIDLNKGLFDVVADAQNLPFRSMVFDQILLSAIREHLDLPLKCLREAIRVAADDAAFIIVIPIEARFHIVDLKRVILEFPFGLIIAFKRMLKKHRNPKPKEFGHKNCIHPPHKQTPQNRRIENCRKRTCMVQRQKGKSP